MKLPIALGVTAFAAACASAPRLPPPPDGDFAGLTTPFVLTKGRSDLGIQVNSFRGTDYLFRTGMSYAIGVGSGWEAGFAGTYGKENAVTLANNDIIDYGGSDADLLLKYRLPGAPQIALQGGVGYSHTPSQLERASGFFAASVGWSVARRIRVYANPKLVDLTGNVLVGVGLGGVVDAVRGVQLFGDWTPLLAGDNTISLDGASERVALYAVGVRFPDLVRRVSLDIGYTNVIGETAGFSLTPSLGNTGGLYASLACRF